LSVSDTRRPRENGPAGEEESAAVMEENDKVAEDDEDDEVADDDDDEDEDEDKTDETASVSVPGAHRDALRAEEDQVMEFTAIEGVTDKDEILTFDRRMPHAICACVHAQTRTDVRTQTFVHTSYTEICKEMVK
jgi:hypothetical protein